MEDDMGMDVEGKNGNYFRANVWSWRPLCDLMEKAGFDVPENWHYNDGAGLVSHVDCNKLADLLQAHLTMDPSLEFEMPGPIYARADYTLTTEPEPGTRSAYSITRPHVEDFITFLRECGGGFEIW